jgi:hypothetical protein
MKRHHRLLYALLYPALAASLGRPRLILVLGSMRSGSSLLTHVLSSHPDILGFGEAHVRYDKPSSVVELGYWLLRFRRRWPGGARFLLDKVLHENHLPDLAMLAARTDLRIVMMTRGPSGNIASLAKMFAGKGDAGDYYVKRVAELSALVERIPAATPFHALSYEALTADPDRELVRLTAFLGLETPLLREYSLNEASGRWGVGDGSANIRAGEILARDAAAAPPAPAGALAAHRALVAKLIVRDAGFRAGAGQT